jgi:ribosomal-protein-alanine N-acetyltransferase
MLPELSSARLRLSPATSADADTLWTLWTDPLVRQFLFDDIAIARQRASEILADFLALAERGLGLWLIQTRTGDDPIGCVALAPISTVAEYEPRLAELIEILIAQAPTAWHQGYALEAMSTVLNYAFGPLRLAQVVAAADEPNVASHRLLARLGFELFSACPGPRYSMRTYTRSSGAAPSVSPSPAVP